MIEELRGTSTLYGSNAPFIEQQYEIYLANPGAVSADWRAYFDELRDGAQDVAHAPVIDSFIQLAKNRRLAAPMPTTGPKLSSRMTDIWWSTLVNTSGAR